MRSLPRTPDESACARRARRRLEIRFTSKQFESLWSKRCARRSTNARALRPVRWIRSNATRGVPFCRPPPVTQIQARWRRRALRPVAATATRAKCSTRGDELNTATNDAAPSVSTDRRQLMFWSLRAGGFGPGDIYVSTRANAHEPWSTPKNVGPPLDTAFNDLRPNLSRSGRTLLFDSNRPGFQGAVPNRDLWMSTRIPGCR